MSLPPDAKPALLALILGWPAAVGVGFLLAHVTQTNWPAGVVPTGWLVLVFVVLRRYAESDSR